MFTILIYALFTGLSGLTHSLFWFGTFQILDSTGSWRRMGSWRGACCRDFSRKVPAASPRNASGLLCHRQHARGGRNAAHSGFSYRACAKGRKLAVGVCRRRLPCAARAMDQAICEEPERWEHARAEAERTGNRSELGAIGELITNPVLRRNTIAAVLMAAAGVGGFWGVGNWTPELNECSSRPTRISIPPRAGFF